MNRCTAETDPLGRTTRAGYDGAGRLVWQENPDGRRLTWTYDPAGRPAGMAVDGRPVTALTRDLRRRTLTIHDTTSNTPCEHELRMERPRPAAAPQPVATSRSPGPTTRPAAGPAMTTPDGQTTRYGWDIADRLSFVEHPLLGRASLRPRRLRPPGLRGRRAGSCNPGNTPTATSPPTPSPTPRAPPAPRSTATPTAGSPRSPATPAATPAPARSSPTTATTAPTNSSAPALPTVTARPPAAGATTPPAG